MSKYYDNAATTKISKQALEAYNETAMKYFANPSANHSLGNQSKECLINTRIKIGELLDINPNTIYFTSGGSESNSIVLSSLFWNKSPGEIIISKTEHSSILNYEKFLTDKGYKIIKLDAPNGFVSPETLNQSINSNTRMVVIQSVNNVVGSINDIESLVKVVRAKEKTIKRKIFFHCDAVQALTKISLNLKQLGVDSASFSAHKFHGPRGIGFLYLKNKTILPLSKGGGQEKGLRSGTENLAAIVAMQVAIEENFNTSSDNVVKINKYVRENLKPIIITPNHDYSPFIINFTVSPFPSEVFNRMLDDEGFIVSAGSACSNNVKTKGEGVLQAMKIKSNYAKSSIRISFNKNTDINDTIYLVKKINYLYDTLIR